MCFSVYLLCAWFCRWPALIPNESVNVVLFTLSDVEPIYPFIVILLSSCRRSKLLLHSNCQEHDQYLDLHEEIPTFMHEKCNIWCRMDKRPVCIYFHLLDIYETLEIKLKMIKLNLLALNEEANKNKCFVISVVQLCYMYHTSWKHRDTNKQNNFINNFIFDVVIAYDLANISSLFWQHALTCMIKVDNLDQIITLYSLIITFLVHRNKFHA